MPLIKCPECDTEYSEYAQACPKCHCPTAIAKSGSEGGTHSPFGNVPQANLTVRGFQEGMLFGQERYELVSRLGRGGFGEVWKAKDILASTESREVFVAVKLIPPDISRTPREIEGIKKNYALVEGLVHQHIAALKGLIQDGDDTLLLMECVDGCDLVDYRKQYMEKHGSFPESEAIRIGMQIAQALDYAHSRKVLHRDIKPENIMITTSGDVKVLDFGLAAEIQSSMNRVSMAVTDTSGTRPYMSPEQWQGKPQGQASDLYSLAVLVYEMLCGELPFVCDDTAVLRECVLKQNAERKGGIPDQAWTGLQVGLSKEPDQRFLTCVSLISEMLEPGASGHSLGKSAAKSSGGGNTSIEDEVDIFSIKEDHAWIWIRDLLRASGCEVYIANFKKQGITGEMFFSVSDQDLINIGINMLGDRKTILQIIENRRDQYGSVMQLLTSALIESDPQSQYSLACEYAGLSDEFGFLPSQMNATRLLRLAAESGTPPLKLNVADILARGDGVERDPVFAAAIYVEAADKGNSAIQLQVADRFSSGEGIDQDKEKAAKWYEKAAEQGNDGVQRAVAEKFSNGDGVDQDLDKAKKWYLKAFESSATDIQFIIAEKFFRGDGVVQDHNTAIMIYTRSASQGCTKSQMRLSSLYSKGIGVEKDRAEAFKWCLKAAEGGNPVAQFNIAECNRKGNIVKRDPDEAISWYQMAAYQGHQKSRDALKKMGVHKIYKRFPFDVVEANGQQQHTAKILGVPVEFTVDLPNGVKMEFMLIPAGEFMMGSPENEEDRQDSEEIHRVRITKPFYMAKYQCTQEQWWAITGENPSHFKGNPRNPVEQVSWDEINDRFLPAIQKHAPKGMTFRLPTEAQWEYACRAGTSTPFHFGATITADQVNYNGNHPYGNAPKGQYREETTPVGTFPANAWGLHDMHGNVWEWCRDFYADDFYSKSPTDDPENTKTSKGRVPRGGCWGVHAGLCRSAYRIGSFPHGGGSGSGFRLALDRK